MNADIIKQRLLKNRKIDPVTECWEWQRSSDSYGYGYIWLGKWSGLKPRMYKVHRVSAFMWKNFDIISRMLVCHHCDNPICFNPNHLFIGTYKDNAQDCIKKGRESRLVGENHGMPKLTLEQVIEIKKRRRGGEELKSICVDYPVNISVISKIARGDLWSHIL